MSLFFTKPRERRSTWAEWMSATDVFGSKTASGVNVTPDKAMRVSAFWSTTHLLASIVSGLPVDVFRGSGPQKREVSPQPPFIATPSHLVTRREWMYQAMVSLLQSGNADGIGKRDNFARWESAEWLDISGVTIKQPNALTMPTYWMGTEQIDPNKVVHLRAFCRPGSVIGRSVVEYQAEQLGISLAGRDYGAGFYAGGGHPTALFANSKQAFTPEQSSEMKRRYRALMDGKREPLLVGSDWTYTPIQASMAESALVETMGYTDAQIARLYGPGLAEILGFTTPSGGSLTYTNRLDRSLDVLQFTASYWVSLFEDFLTDALARPQTARLNVASLLRMDPKAQAEMFRTYREIGLRSIDEIRDLIDLPPLPDEQGTDYTPLKSSGPPKGEPNGDA